MSLTLAAHEAPNLDPELMPEQLEPGFIDPRMVAEVYQSDLLKSAAAWRSIAAGARQNEALYPEIFKESWLEAWKEEAPKGYEHLASEANVDKMAAGLASDLTLYSLAVARHFSSGDPHVNLQASLKDQFVSITSEAVRPIFQSDKFPLDEFIYGQQELVRSMREADDIGNRVLLGLIEAYQNHPEQLETLAHLYLDEDAAESDAAYAELRLLVSTDWHRPNPEQSILRRFCRDLESNRAPHIEEFVDDMVEGEDTRQRQTVRSMARFAVAATGQDIDDPSALRRVLRDTAPQWQSFEEIDILFKSFVGAKVNAVTNALSMLAGSKNTRNFRTFPSQVEVDRFKENITPVITDGSRGSRRVINRHQKKKMAKHTMPTVEDIDIMANTPVSPEAEPKSILLAKGGVGGAAFEEVSTQDLVERFKIGHENGLSADMIRSVEWLRRHPMARGSKRLVSNASGNAIRFDGRRLPLRRFAPSASPDLSMPSENGRWRIVYAFTKKHLVVQRIVHHNEFDDLYT